MEDKNKHENLNSQPAENEEVLKNAPKNAEATSEIAAASVVGAGTPPKTADKKPEKIVIVDGKEYTKKEITKTSAMQWVLIVLGAIMMASSVYFFQEPNSFVLGGIAGISIVLSNLVSGFAPFLTYDVVMVIINVILLIVGFIILGKKCTLRTIVCTLLYNLIILLFKKIELIGLINGAQASVPSDQITLTTEPLLELCFAILLFGVGGAIIFNNGASSGGTDIIALILKKYTKLNVGVALMIVDLIIVAISFFTFKSLEAGLFSVLGLFTKTFILDGVIESMGKTKHITIITKHPEAIGEYILKTMRHGYTIHDAEGGYTHEKKKIIITVCKRGEALRIKMKLKDTDPEAFIIITDANEILGKGFGAAV